MTTEELKLMLSRRLRDVSKRQWDDAILDDALQAAYVALCNADPSAYTVREQIEVVEGTEQTLPDHLTGIVRLDRNVCNNHPIVKCDRSILDKAHRNWRNDPPRGYVWHWMQDGVDKNRFSVWPQVGNPPEQQ